VLVGGREPGGGYGGAEPSLAGGAWFFDMHARRWSRLREVGAQAPARLVPRPRTYQAEAHAVLPLAEGAAALVGVIAGKACLCALRLGVQDHWRGGGPAATIQWRLRLFHCNGGLL
jgi:hypothetical protein